MPGNDIASTILRMVESVQADERQFGVYSTGEKIAVALVLERMDLLAEVNGGYTVLEAVDRLGREWMLAARAVQRALDVKPAPVRPDPTKIDEAARERMRRHRERITSQREQH